MTDLPPPRPGSAATPPPSASETDRQSWDERVWTARLVGVVIYLVPFAMSVGAAFLLSSLLPQAPTLAIGIIRWLGIAIASTLVLILVERQTRRLMPLRTLLGLALNFPDKAPSRFKIAIRTGTTRELRTRLDEARVGRLGDTPSEAAERLLELVGMLSQHDRLTRGHSERVRAYSHMIGEEMGLSGRELDRLRWAGLLHDVGKLAIPTEILNKPGKLTDEEYELIKSHPLEGQKLVEPLADWLGDAARAVWEHHERFDGAGYPYGLAGHEISRAARIVSVADVFDVITSVRSYKAATTAREAREELARCAGTHFDPEVVKAFLALSVGRVRRTIGPLSWLAQLSLFPGAIASQAAPTLATAAAMTAGAAAGTVGIVVDPQPAVARPQEFSIPADDVLPDMPAPSTTVWVIENAAPASSDAAPPQSSPAPTPTALLPASNNPPPATTAPTTNTTTTSSTTTPTTSTTTTSTTTPTTTSPTTSTSTPPVTVAPVVTVPVTVAPVVTVPPTTTTTTTTTTTLPPTTTTTTTTTTLPPTTTTTTTLPPTTLPPTTLPPTTTTTTTTTTLPPTTLPPTTTTTLPPTTLPPTTLPPTTLPPTTLPPTTLPPTTTTTTTLPPAPPVDFAPILYLTPSGPGDTPSTPQLPLSSVFPSAQVLANYDTDRDSLPGLRIGRDAAGVTTLDPANRQVFAGQFAQQTSIVANNARLFLPVASTDPSLSSLHVQARVELCSNGVCTILGTDSRVVPNAADWRLAIFAFGSIDVVAEPGDTLYLTVAALDDSEADMMIAYGTSFQAAAIWFA